MKTTTIIKIAAGLIVLILMVFFVYENLDPIPIWIPFVKGRHFGLIYIILTFYLIGATNAAWVMVLIGRHRRRRAKLEEVPEHKQMLFEDEA